MNPESKVTPEHLKRAAYLYIRQSTLHQVQENTESTQRQYALRQRAVALGWPEERIVVIDHDQGQSGASATDREGFQKLVADVGLGKAGIVMGLEVSRLARNCADWHRLLELCALTHALILDQDGLYDPGHYNDRLLLGLKGTMSEAELHILRARMIGGLVNKAQRAELKMPLPVGLVYNDEEGVCLDPDQQVQQSLRVFFATFDRTGSGWSTVKAFRRQGLKFPRRSEDDRGEIVWQEMTLGLALHVLHNPRYAGAFCYGRTRLWKDADGKHHSHRLPREEWRFLKHNAHPGYITWDQFLANQQRLLENYPGSGQRQVGAAREGPALLQGLVICGKCGRMMTVTYHHRHGRLTPDYQCLRVCSETAGPVCQRIPGAGVDEEIGRLLVQSVTPLALEVAWHVQKEIQARRSESCRLREQQVQRAQYEADRARLRYMRVDPNNRLVADTLETQWNDKLKSLTELKEECERQQRLDSAPLTDDQKTKIFELASEFPKLWQNSQTEPRDRKRMVRLLLEDITLRREQEEISVQVRFKGGATRELRLPFPKPGWALRQTKPEIITEIDRLLTTHTEGEIAQILNKQGCRSGTGLAFTGSIVSSLQHKYELKSHYERLREKGFLTASEVARIIGGVVQSVHDLRRAGLLAGVPCSDNSRYLFHPPTPDVIQTIRSLHGHHSEKSAANKPTSKTSLSGVV